MECAQAGKCHKRQFMSDRKFLFDRNFKSRGSNTKKVLAAVCRCFPSVIRLVTRTRPLYVLSNKLLFQENYNQVGGSFDALMKLLMQLHAERYQWTELEARWESTLQLALIGQHLRTHTRDVQPVAITAYQSCTGCDSPMKMH